jgi:tetratricopeptide (TPR) repeat protein
VRVRRHLLLVSAGLLVGHAALAQDFDPRGRHHGPPPAGGHAPAGGHGRPAGQGAGRPQAPVVTSAVLIERYTKVALAQPGVAFPLQRLAQLYRDRDGKLDALITDLQARLAAATTNNYPERMALAGVYKLNGDAARAQTEYGGVIALYPREAAPLLALARLEQDRADLAAARTHYEQALALQTLQADKSTTLHALQTLALDLKDWEAAQRYHRALVLAEPNSLFVKGELGRELFSRGEYERAEAEYKEVVKAAQGDNRTLAPALKDLGQAQAKAHKYDEALATLDKALGAAGSGAAVRNEIYQTITEVYRAQQNLPALIKKLEDQHPGDYIRLALLGSLYEETGDATHALAFYQRALAIEPRQIDLRVRMIRLLQAEGEIEKAIVAYEGIIRTSPNNPQFVFEMCDALIQRGERARALRLLSDLEARGSTDEEVMSRLGEFYSRIGESEKALHVLTRLADIAGSDPSHIADLGDHYFQEGKLPLAIQTWKRILTSVTPRAKALAALGGIYMEHDMLPDALQVLREATELDPQNLAYKKDLATAFERNKSYRDATQLWEVIGEKAAQQSDRVLAREVRSHVVTLWALEHVLDQQVPRLSALFDGQPPDVEAGRTLAEVLAHQKQLARAEAALDRVIQLAPGDAESYLALERVCVQRGNLEKAITVLTRLVAVEPKRSREIYQRMATYAIALYKDKDAIIYAARAVELNPEDADAHKRLGDMYAKQQDTENAILQYRAAIAKNERLFLVYFDLADLLLAKGETDEADRLLRRVLRGAPDEELVSRAARQSMQLNLGRGTLQSLEQDLVPLAIGNPQKSIYRKLLVEMYGNLTFGLVQRVKHGVGKDEEEARAALAKVGQRAVKPLLDALADGDGGQQRVAIDVLAYVANKNSGPALFGFAIGNGDTALRLRAMIACGVLKDPGLLPRYSAYLLPKGASADELSPTDSIAIAAVWGVARMNDGRSLPLLRTLAKTGSAEVRALAVLGIGALGDKASIPEVTSILRELDAGDVARASAAYALGELGADAATPYLVTMAEEGDPLPRQMALLALARLWGGHGGVGAAKGGAVLAAMADAVFSGGDPDSARARAVGASLRKAGAAALIAMAGGQTKAGTNPEVFPIPEASVEVDSLLTSLVPTGFTPKERAGALLHYADVLGGAAKTALETSSDRARTVLAALAEGNGSFEPFLGPEEEPETAPARVKAKALILALEPNVLALVRHPDARLRMQALTLLSSSDSAPAALALVDAATDADEQVQRAALAALGTRPSHRVPEAWEACAKMLAHNESWALRVIAAEALGRLGKLSSGEGPKIASDALAEAAISDSYALVREACLVALASVDRPAALRVAARAAAEDAEPRVRDSARGILGAP